MSELSPSQILHFILGVRPRTLAIIATLLGTGAITLAEERQAQVNVSDRTDIIQDIALGAGSNLMGVGAILAGVLAMANLGKRPAAKPEA